MLEILVLVGLCKVMGEMMRKKGRSPLWLQIMLVPALFGGEFFGGIVYGVYQAIQGVEITGELDLAIYGVALAGGATGVAAIFLLGALIPAAQPQPQPMMGEYGYNPYPTPPPGDSQNPYNPYGDPRT